MKFTYIFYEAKLIKLDVNPNREYDVEIKSRIETHLIKLLHGHHFIRAWNSDTIIITFDVPRTAAEEFAGLEWLLRINSG